MKSYLFVIERLFRNDRTDLEFYDTVHIFNGLYYTEYRVSFAKNRYSNELFFTYR